LKFYHYIRGNVTPWCGAGKLIAARLALLFGLAVNGAIFDDVILVASRAFMHRYILQQEESSCPPKDYLNEPAKTPPLFA
jgi:hypothetical protein